MRYIASRVVLFAAIVCLGAAPWQPTVSDLVALKHLALEHGPPVHYFAKSPSEMPPFDRIVFYPGGADRGWIWENRGEETSAGRKRAMSHALILAAMDSGAAGQRWKHYYDLLAARDDAQAKGADPYRFRHAFLRELDAKLTALAPPFPAAADDASVNEAASRFTDQDLASAVRGLYATPITPKVGVLPAGTIARYDGRLGLGNYVIERSPLIDTFEFYTDEEPPGSEDAVVGAMFQAVVDSGAAGQALKARYDEAADKRGFGIALAKAFDLQNERTEAHSRSEIAWMRATLRPGITSKDADALLRSHNLVLRYSHGSGFIEFPIQSSFACGTSITVTVKFDSQQRVQQVEEAPAYTACL